MREALVGISRTPNIQPAEQTNNIVGAPLNRNHDHSKKYDLSLVRRDAEEAARFYAETFPDSSVDAVHQGAGRFSGRAKGRGFDRRVYRIGNPLPRPKRRADVQAHRSVLVPGRDRDQEETDRYWNAIVGNGGQESACGWCKDKWGLSWQITPIALTEGVTDPDPAVAKRVFEAMMTMKKIDIAAIEAARNG